VRQKHQIVLNPMPTGASYEEEYGKWLDVFREVAFTTLDFDVEVIGPPVSWVPLLERLGARVVNPRILFQPQDQLAQGMLLSDADDDAHGRTILEAVCSLRPETADSLYLFDTTWDSARVQGAHELMTTTGEIVMPSNASHNRPEIVEYLRILRAYTPRLKKAVLVPCAADKPYPSRLHRAVRNAIADDWYQVVVTGALGLVPEELWPLAPLYDAGPFVTPAAGGKWRVFDEARRYFGRHKHEKVVIYCSSYADPLQAAFNVHLADGIITEGRTLYAPDYMEPAALETLRRATRGEL